MSDTPNLRQAALDYHEHPRPGKLEVRATKPLANGRDLARAYSPGVAEACIEIKNDPDTAARYTSRGNLVAVLSNGRCLINAAQVRGISSSSRRAFTAISSKDHDHIVYGIENGGDD